MKYSMLHILVEYGELIPKAEDYFEDMGGHLIYADDFTVKSYFQNFIKHLTKEERNEVLERLGGTE